MNKYQYFIKRERQSIISLCKRTVSDQSKCEWGEWIDMYGCNTGCTTNKTTGKGKRFKYRNKTPVEGHEGICTGQDSAWEECDVQPCQCAANKQPCDVAAMMGEHLICCNGLACIRTSGPIDIWSNTKGQCEISILINLINIELF